MLPTIDISLIGVLIAVWHVVLVIWDIFCKGFNWLTQHAIALVVGSKFWALTFFFTLFVAIIALFSVVIQAFATYVASLIYTTMPSMLQRSVDLFGTLIPLDELASCLSYLASATTAYYTLDVTQMSFSRIWILFRGLQRSWKM